MVLLLLGLPPFFSLCSLWLFDDLSFDDCLLELSCSYSLLFGCWFLLFLLPLFLPSLGSPLSSIVPVCLFAPGICRLLVHVACFAERSAFSCMLCCFCCGPRARVFFACCIDGFKRILWIPMDSDVRSCRSTQFGVGRRGVTPICSDFPICGLPQMGV